MEGAKNFRSWTKYPNTPESDKEEFVMHIVRFEVPINVTENDGKSGDELQPVEYEVMARCPIEAIEHVQNNWL